MSDLIQLRSTRPATGFALFDKGFRPFFALAALFAVLGVPAWVLVRRLGLHVGEHLLPSAWHAHEMVFGFSVAVIGGFLLTAASNWTKRVTAVGLPLVGLCLVWVAGRVGLLLDGLIDVRVVAALNLAFLPLLAFAVGRPIVLARSRRNYGLVVVLLALFAAQALTHAGAVEGSVVWQTLGPRLGVGLVIVVILVVGGRIIPLFTRNATGADGIRSLPWLDRASIASAVALIALDAAALLEAPWLTPTVSGVAIAVVASAAALTSLARARHWGAQHTLAEPLLWVLHVGYLFVPLGFALRAVAALSPRFDDSSALHALTVGAVGTLTLGMMARVSLGHTGRPLRAGKALGAAFGLVVAAALVRVVGPQVGPKAVALDLSSTLWAVGFLIYLVRAAPMLLRARPDGKPG